MKNFLWSILLLGASSTIKALKVSHGDHMELTRLKASLMYVRSIKTFRLLFMSLSGIGMCLIFLFVGLVLFHVSLFVYAPWSTETKMLVGFLCSGIYLLATFILFSKIFAQDQWLKIFHAEGIMEHLKEGPDQKDSEKPDESRQS